MSIVFQCSVRKANWKMEKTILIEAGLMTEWQDNTWIRYRQWYFGQWRLTAEDSFTNHLNLIVTANQMATIVAMHKLNPTFSDRDLIRCIKLNARNKSILLNSPYKDLVE